VSPPRESIEAKICGVNTADSFDAAYAAGADWIGFVFFPRSPRYVTPDTAAALSARRPGGPGRVGLFVEPDDAAVATVLAALDLDALQIYATADRAAALRVRFDRPVWHAVGVAAAADLPRAAPGIDRLLIEAKPPPAATRPGGNAARFDWSLLAGWQAPLPWVLAGGLDPDNVGEAIRTAGARAVDVSSGVEAAAGVKDPARIRAFIDAVRAAKS
jgi:phosphoribosylanthranilate isomerase